MNHPQVLTTTFLFLLLSQELLSRLGAVVMHDSMETSPGCPCCKESITDNSTCDIAAVVSWVHVLSNAGMRFQERMPLAASVGIEQRDTIDERVPVTASTGSEREELLHYCRAPPWAWELGGRRFKVIWHLVRDPLRAISSRASLNAGSIEWFAG